MDGEDGARLGRVVGDASSSPDVVELKLIGLPEHDESSDSVPSCVVVDLWESIGILRPRKLLADLGFVGDRLDPLELLDCIEMEIHALSSADFCDPSRRNESLVLFRAVVRLYRYEIDNAKAILERTTAERDKLRVDLQDANRRAALLADDVDENHLRLEAASESRLRSLERKHRETVQRLTSQLEAEKETSAATIAALETRLNALRAEELKLKHRLESAGVENERNEREKSALRDDVRELRESNGRLAREVRALSDGREEPDGRDERDDVSRLEEIVRDLRAENVRLKDRNDELNADLEELHGRWEANGTTKPSSEEKRDQSGSNGIKRRGPSPSWSRSEFDGEGESPRINKVRKCENFADEKVGFGDESSCDKLKALENFVVSHAFDRNLVSDESHATGDSIENVIFNLKNKDCSVIREIFDKNEYGLYCLAFYYLFHEIKNNIDKIPVRSECRSRDDLGKFKICLNEINKLKPEYLTETGEDSEDSEDAAREAAGSYDEICLLKSDIHSEISIVQLKMRIADLEKNLEDERTSKKVEREKHAEKCQELETNIESLRAVYEESEEYWASKLKEEREMFDQEQQISDEKFSDLMNKLAEYEEQFALKDSKSEFCNRPLSTIDEKCALEKQFTDLEDEFQEYKTKMRLEIEEKNSEIERLIGSVKLLKDKHKDEMDSSISPVDGMNLHDGGVPRSVENGKYDSISRRNVEDSHPIASPIEYLWSQKTISSPLNNNRSGDNKVRDYQNPIFSKDQTSKCDVNVFVENNHVSPDCESLNKNGITNITPIQKPCNIKLSPTRSNGRCGYINSLEKKLEGKILHCSDLEQALQGRQKQNREQENIQTKYNPDLHSSTNHRILQQETDNSRALLEMQCRQLQTALLQQQAYAESVMQQTLAVHRGEIGALRQKLAAADLLIRDLYVENCRLTENMINPPLL